MANLEFPGLYAGLEELVAAASPQAFTGSWADLGSELVVKGARAIGLWVTLDINDTVNPRVRALVKHTAAGTEEYLLPIRTVGASAVLVEDEYVEFNVDADQLMLLSWDLDGLVPVVQFQIQAGTAGVSPGQIDAAYVSTAM